MTLQAALRFDGPTFDAARDGQRLTEQLHRVKALVRDGQWRTLADIAAQTGDPEASVSARLRDLRKKKFGGHALEKRFVRRGLWMYRVVWGAEG